MPGPYTDENTAAELVADFADQIKGKTILTTGVSPKSLGASFVTAVAAGKPALLILAGRNTAKLQETADVIKKEHPDVPTRLLELDLSSFATVRKSAEEFNSWKDVPVLDVLVNNAGIMAVPYKLSPDGYESQFASNYLGHFLFTNLIMPKILASKEPRVVSVASEAHGFSAVRLKDINFLNGSVYEPWKAYGQSKTANMLFALSLADKLGSRGLQAYSLHPGAIATGLAAHLTQDDFASSFQSVKELGFDPETVNVKYLTVEQGAATHVLTAFSPDLKEHNGAYFIPTRLANADTDNYRVWGESRQEADRLWRFTEKIFGQEFKY